jgi:hypothetical protein
MLMGFPYDHAAKALTASQGCVQRAVELLACGVDLEAKVAEAMRRLALEEEAAAALSPPPTPATSLPTPPGTLARPSAASSGEHAWIWPAQMLQGRRLGLGCARPGRIT